MADGELGNLRRAPRIIEHKISKQSRYRTEGMAGGQFDAVIPVDVTDTVSSLSDSASDGGGPVPEWYTESFTLASGAASTVTLTYIPLDYSEILTLNGIRLSETTDYTIADNVVTWTSVSNLILGIGSDSWTLTATYPYYDQASAPDPSLLAVYRDQGLTIGSRTVLLSSAPLASNFAILLTSGAAASVSGAFATWTQIRSGGGSNANVAIWTGVGVGSGSTITIGGGPTDNNTVVGVYDGVSAVAIADIQSTSYGSAFTGNASSPTGTAVLADIVVGGVRVRHGFLNDFETTGTHAETGFGTLAASADSHETGTSSTGVGGTFGVASATSITSSFGVADIGGAGTGTGEAITVAFTWTPA